MKKFADLIKYAYVFANDLKNIHWHAIGEKFDIIHSISEELYKEALAEVDDFAEMAISSGEVVESLNQLNELEDWTFATDTAYDWDKFVSFLSTNGLKYLECLQDVETDNSGYKSLLDNYITFWSKEINYKNSNRAIENPEKSNIPVESSAEIEDNSEEVKENSDAFIGMDDSDYSNVYTEDDENIEDSDAEDFADMTKVYDNNDQSGNSTWKDMVAENGDTLDGEFLDTSDMNEEPEEKSKSNLTQMSDDMIVSNGEKVTPSYNFEM